MRAERLRQVHQGRCPECGGAGPVDVHTSHQVTSVLVMTSWNSRPKVCCRSCGVKSQLGGLAWSAVLGWWGFPWGPLLTPIQIVRNLLGLIRPPQASEPTAQLRKMVNLELASQLADRLSRVTTEVEEVTEAPEVVVECESCSSTFTVGEELAGCAVTCPDCGEPVIAVLDSDEPVPLVELPLRRGKGSESPKSSGLGQNSHEFGYGDRRAGRHQPPGGCEVA